MRKLLYSLLAILLISSSCQMVGGKRVKGNGNVIKESHKIQPFSDLEVSGEFEVRLTQDSLSSLLIETDENLQSYITVKQEGDLLSLDTRNGYSLRPSHKIIVYLSNSAYRDFKASGAVLLAGKNKLGSGQPLSFQLVGACEVDMAVKAEKVRVDASGACSIKLSGETRDLSIDGEGASEIRCFDLLSENTDISMAGAGDAEVYASVTLKAKTAGAADIRYKGDATVTKSIAGAGSVKKE